MGAKMVRVLAANGAERAWVVTGDGPIDESVIDGPDAGADPRCRRHRRVIEN